MITDAVVKALVTAAQDNGIRPEALCALVEVETAGIPFENDNHTPRLLYERHVAYKEANKKGILNKFTAAGLAIQKWSRTTQYKDQGSSPARLALIARARAINEEVANRSASWGLGQTMGFLAEEQGFTDATEMVEHMTGSIAGQIDCMLRELKNKKLIAPLNNREYARVARVYNGPGYAQNKYDTRIADADKRWARRLGTLDLERETPPEQKLSRAAIKEIQSKLKELTYTEVGNPDGVWGTRTTGALSAFQAHEGLPVTGHYDDTTKDALEQAEARPIAKERENITSEELKESGSRTIAVADNLSMFGKAKLWIAGIVGGGAGADHVGLLDGTLEKVDTAQGLWERVSSFHIPINILLIVAALVGSGALVMWIASKIKSYRTEDYASGCIS